MAAALELFVSRGYAATRLDDVARAAGVSKGTLYLYFDSKESLFKAVINEGILPVMVEGEALAAGFRGTASDLLRDLFRRWWNTIGATELAGVPKLMISESGNFPEVAQYYYDHVIVRGRALMASVLRRGIGSGEFRDLDVEVAIDVLFAPLLMLVIWRYSLAPCAKAAGDQDPLHYLDVHLSLALDGLRHPNSPQEQPPCDAP